MLVLFTTLLALAAPQTGPSTEPPVAPPSDVANVESSALPLDPSAWMTPGARIPDVELPRVDGGGLVRLSQYEGKKVLLLQFASW